MYKYYLYMNKYIYIYVYIHIKTGEIFSIFWVSPTVGISASPQFEVCVSIMSCGFVMTTQRDPLKELAQNDPSAARMSDH